MQYLKLYGAQLAALGYRIVPLPPGSKGPRRPGWQKLEATAELVARWTANGSADDGVGILAAHTPAIDVDVLDPEVAAHMQAALETIFGPLAHIRVGRAPKFLIPFRCDEPFRKLSSAVYVDVLTGDEHRVEVLGDGQQWVAYHEHPDTLQPYDWTRGGLLGLPRDQLPVLTLEGAQEAMSAFETIASDLVAAGTWELKARPHETRAAPTADALLDWKPTIDFKTLKSALSKIPNRGHGELDYDAWRDVIFAIHRETNGAAHGFALANAWSARASKHNPEFLAERVWPYITDRADGVTGLTILKRARSLGWKPDEGFKPVTPESGFVFHAGDAYAQDFAGEPELVEDVLPSRGVAMLYGPSGKGKTFWMLDLAFHVHNGLPWRDKDTARGQVFYIAAEAGRGIKKRIQAVKVLHPEWAAPFIADAAPNLSSTESIEAIRDGVQRAGGAALIIIDTMSASFQGDDSSQQDVAAMMRNLTALATELACLVVFVHHTTKDGDSWRGSGVLFADVDAVLELRSEGEGVRRRQWVTQRKHREGEDGAVYPFELAVSAALAVKDNGRPITSCTVTQTNDRPQPRGSKNRAIEFLTEVYEKAGGGLDGMSAVELLEAAAESHGKGFRKDNYRQALATYFEFEGGRLPDGYVVYL